MAGLRGIPCCRNIAAQGSFDAKHELQSFVHVKYEKVAESVRDVQRKFREDREHARGEKRAADEQPPVVENIETIPMAVDTAGGVPCEENSQLP